MKCGYFKKEFTPPAGGYMSGKAYPRISQGVEDPLNIRAIAFEEESVAVVLVFDLVGMYQDLCNTIRDYVASKLGMERNAILVSCTHTHYAPVVNNNVAHSEDEPVDQELVDALPRFALSAAQGAIADLKEASVFGAQSELENIAFIRRFRMKDGSVRTNPGRKNPDVVGPMSPADETIRLVKFVREGADEILLVNFQVHPDVVNTKGYSADYPAVVCNTLENALPGTKCIYLNGTAGDLNHVDIKAPEWDPCTGPNQAAHMGRSIAGKILSMYTKARPIETGPVCTAEKLVTIKLKEPTPERIPEAKELLRLHEAGLDDQIPYKGMEFITALFEARQILARSMPDYKTEKTVVVSGLSLGDICVIGIPGEGFCDIGRQIRENSAFPMQLTLGICNGYEGYFPMKDAFEVNGYESRTSQFVAGIGEALAEAGKEVTRTLRNA